jgi:Lon protease-like protein
MASQTFSLPPNFNGEVRLFPLPNLVMFPSNVLPLHIFESRYREMLEDAIQGDQLITIATLLPGFDHEYYSRPPVAPVVCIGQVTAHEKTEQGTYNLALVGLQRAEIDHEIEPVRSFRRASVKLYDDHSPESDEAIAKLVQQLAKRSQQLLPSAKKLFEEFSRHNIPLGSLTDVLAFHLPLAVDLKLKLLAEPEVLTRAQLLLDSLPAAKEEGGGRKPYPTDFSAN